MSKIDTQIDDCGSVVLVTPVTKAAKEWVKEHLSLEGWQWLGNCFAVEGRFAPALVQGMRSDGLRVG